MIRNCLIIVFIFCLTSVKAQDGSLDLSFGDNGIFYLDYNDAHEAGHALDQFEDGKIITGGFMLTNQNELGYFFAKFTPDGQPDPSFGDNGILLGDPFIAHDVWEMLALDDNSFIASMQIVGPNGPRFLRKFLPDGSIDMSFGVNGQFDMNFDVSQMILQSDGKILVVGWTSALKVLRLLPDGQVDTTYGDDGITTIIGGQSWHTPHGVMTQEGGLLITAGGFENGFAKLSVVKLNSNGAQDFSFGNNGSIGILYDYYRVEPNIDVYDDGRFVVVAGIVWWWDPYGNLGFFNEVMRYSATGELDTDFGTNGIKEIPGTGFSPLIVKIQENSRILTGGISPNKYVPKFRLFRMYNNGVTDLSFIQDAYPDFQCAQVIETNDKKILASGDIIYNSLILVQFNNSPLSVEDYNTNVFEVYPNPTSGVVYIDLKESDIVDLAIYDINGRLLRTMEVNSRQNTIDLSDLTSGIYLLRIDESTIKILKY